MTIELRCLACEQDGIISPFETGMGDESVIDLSHLLGTKDKFLDLSDLPDGKPDLKKLRIEEAKTAEIIVRSHAAMRHVVPAARQAAAERLAKEQDTTAEEIFQKAASRGLPLLLPGEWDLRSKMPRPEMEVSEWKRPFMIPSGYLGLTE